jgi:hypothetical protein
VTWVTVLTEARAVPRLGDELEAACFRSHVYTVSLAGTEQEVNLNVRQLRNLSDLESEPVSQPAQDSYSYGHVRSLLRLLVAE